jgi:hypothetical protein
VAGEDLFERLRVYSWKERERVVTPTGFATSGTPTDAELARLLEDLTVPLSGVV